MVTIPTGDNEAGPWKFPAEQQPPIELVTYDGGDIEPSVRGHREQIEVNT